MKNYKNKKEAWNLWQEAIKKVNYLPEPSINQLIEAKRINGGLCEEKHQLDHYVVDLNDEEIKAEGGLLNSIDVIYSYDVCEKCKKTLNKKITAYFSPMLGLNMDFNMSGLSYTKLLS